MEWNKAGDRIMVGSKDKSIWIWETNYGSCLNVFAGHSDDVSCGKYTNDSNVLLEIKIVCNKWIIGFNSKSVEFKPTKLLSHIQDWPVISK